MPKIIAQRELRNDNARVIDAVSAGETFIVTRNGEPVAELRPLRSGRRRFISRAEVAALATADVRLDRHRFRADLDQSIDQGSDVRSGLLDTSVVIDWHDPAVVAALPESMAISAITSAELTAGPHLARDPAEAARRQARVQEVEAMLEPMPVDGSVVRSYGLVVAAVARHGRAPRSRFADLLIAATAHANQLDLYTRNAPDFAGLEGLVTVIAV